MRVERENLPAFSPDFGGFWKPRLFLQPRWRQNGMFRQALISDLAFVRSLAPGITPQIIEEHGPPGRLRIIEVNGRAVGFLKSYILWENLPFIEVIMISKDQRGSGIGTHAVKGWEVEMLTLGFRVVAISTQEQDSAQNFWRKLGYKDCGRVAISNRPAELFMQHVLCADARQVVAAGV